MTNAADVGEVLLTTDVDVHGRYVRASSLVTEAVGSTMFIALFICKRFGDARGRFASPSVVVVVVDFDLFVVFVVVTFVDIEFVIFPLLFSDAVDADVLPPLAPFSSTAPSAARQDGKRLFRTVSLLGAIMFL